MPEHFTREKPRRRRARRDAGAAAVRLRKLMAVFWHGGGSPPEFRLGKRRKRTYSFPVMTADMVRNSARRRGFPARGILLGLALLLALDIGRYLFWPPVSRLAFINPPFTSMMEYRREQQEARQTEQGKKPHPPPLARHGFRSSAFRPICARPWSFPRMTRSGSTAGSTSAPCGTRWNAI